ncbi:hypothetical protein ACTXGQ_03995 [Marinobacter sp. 1Y8]
MKKNSLVTSGFKCGLFTLSSFALSLSVSAAPSIQNATINGGLSDGSVVELTGIGFGNRQYSAHPILFDFGDRAYENGKLNTHGSQLDEAVPILGNDKGDTDSLWSKPSFAGETARAPILTESDIGQNLGQGRHYLMEGPNSYLGWPNAYGGSDTPIDHHTFYVSWYIKVKYNPAFYWSASPLEPKGDFKPGEDVTVNGLKGSFIGKASSSVVKGMNQFVFPEQLNTNNLRGQVVRGVSSGASVVFPSEPAYGTGNGFENPGSNKVLRVWEDPKGASGLRLSWGNLGFAALGGDQLTELSPGVWHFMELEIDGKSAVGKAYVDRKLVDQSDLSKEVHAFAEGAWSPTIALLGFNGKPQEFQVTEIDDIFMDDELSRVVIGGAPKFSELTHYDLQLTEKWNDNNISFKLNLGKNSTKSSRYLYVIDAAGNVNEDGFPLCDECKSPPSSVQLKVE